LVLESPFGQNQISEKSGGSAQSVLNLGEAKSICVPIPSLEEQYQITTEVERLLSVADNSLQMTEREHTRAERLRQSILKQAFSGQLVPHEGGTASAPAPSGNGAQRPGEQIELEL
jgi:type I restriction enzyme S subunit